MDANIYTIRIRDSFAYGISRMYPASSGVGLFRWKGLINAEKKMDRETLKKGLVLKSKIDQCAELHDILCDASGDRKEVFISIHSEELNRMRDFLVPRELVLDIISVVEKHLTIFQKKFREL